MPVTNGTYDTMNDDSCSTTTELRNPDASSDGDDRSVITGATLPGARKAPSGNRLVAGTGSKKRRSASTLEGVISTKHHLKLVSNELEWERKFRDDQLSRLLKALIYFEARLQSEHRLIRQQLHEKDDVINRQNCTISRMKRKLGVDAESDIDLPEVAQYCPKCRRSYYGQQEVRCSGTQTGEYRGDGGESVNTENLSVNSVEYASSSEEQDSSLYVRANSFKDARRSRKYTSKRSYQSYQRPSRQSSFKSTTSSSVNGGKLPGLSTSCGSTGENNETYENIEPNKNVPKIVIYENYESDKENSKEYKGREANNYDVVEPSYSNRINSMHGLKPITRIDEGGSVDDVRTTGTLKETDEESLLYEGYQDGRSASNQQKYTEGMEMKQTIETSDDWYASASDMEDSDTALGKPYSNAAVNPVLECVNQILLQQSMDGFGENKESTDVNEEELYIKAQEPPKEPTQVRSKRVHFSTQNSMVQVPRINLEPSPVHRKDEKSSPTYEIHSIYSNEYEPIGSEQNSYSNYYVDMESKLGSEDRERELAAAEKRKIPPALPPKPANLLKLQQISKQRMVQIKPKSSSGNSDIAESEPDYCSISEIQDSVKCVQIVAEIHKESCEDDYSVVDEELEETESKKSTDPEESFADVPKLPNVAEIVPPKKETLTKFISQDNYITKSHNGTPAKSTPTKKDGEFREQLSEIIAEINKQSPAIRNASKRHVPVKEMGFRNVSNIPTLGIQSKLKSIDKTSFLSKINSGSTTNLSMNVKLNGSLPRPARPLVFKSNAPVKPLSTNVNSLTPTSPSKSGSYIPNLKSPSAQNAQNGNSPKTSPAKKPLAPVIIAEDSKLPIQAEFDWYNLDAEYGKPNQPDIIIETDSGTPAEQLSSTVLEEKPAEENNSTNGHSSEASGSDLENVEYNLDEAYKTMAPIVPPPDIIQKNPMTTKNGKIPYNSISFKELMTLNETPKIEKNKPSSTEPANANYEHFLDDSGLCSKPIILPRKKRVYYSGPFV
ncbi:uncharacterized protein LOC131678505 isoform X2 [Topomyia yanbarensis]|uniref:uncharacterized protein LOC131678505 isoform X2 n=1 Tax=Topomyia yanbarensis TaxID=2498891 RepID=UPI00273C92DF|nr:uncharacterized protein LOC131678505 isoform X2 [Topomyia yanbarensis]